MDINALLALLLLLLAAASGGFVAHRLHMPPLLGMLVAGFLLGNAPGGPIEALPASWAGVLRLIALTVILLRAGLGLNLDALWRLQGGFLRLSFLPNLAEAGTVAIAAFFILDMPPGWALLLGFVISAVSPAVVVPSLLDLQVKGYGVGKGIPTMVLAAASFDDVISISGFGLALSFVFGEQSDTSLAAGLLRAPLELLLGLGVGILIGLACIPLGKAPAWLRFAALLSLGLVAVFGGWFLGFTGGGSLAAMTMGAVAARGWLQATAPVAKAMSRVWLVAQPILFGLIGAAVSLAYLEPAYVSVGLLILVIGLVIRLMVSYFSVAGISFNSRERLFVALAWIPKATVQAAIGALALDLVRQYDLGAQAEVYGIQVLTLAVLAIVVTAPIGAMLIAWSGPRWLQRQEQIMQIQPHQEK